MAIFGGKGVGAMRLCGGCLAPMRRGAIRSTSSALLLICLLWDREHLKVRYVDELVEHALSYSEYL